MPSVHTMATVGWRGMARLVTAGLASAVALWAFAPMASADHGDAESYSTDFSAHGDASHHVIFSGHGEASHDDLFSAHGDASHVDAVPDAHVHTVLVGVAPRLAMWVPV